MLSGQSAALACETRVLSHVWLSTRTALNMLYRGGKCVVCTLRTCERVEHVEQVIPKTSNGVYVAAGGLVGLRTFAVVVLALLLPCRCSAECGRG